jgi:hypothetical protein
MVAVVVVMRCGRDVQVVVCDARKVSPPAKLTMKFQWIPFTYRQTDAEAAIDQQHHGRLHGLFHHKVRHKSYCGRLSPRDGTSSL